MTTIRLILATVILLLAAHLVVMNWGCVIVSIRNKKRGIDRHHSTVPLLSFFMTIVAMVVYPWPWMIVVPLVDIANWSLVLAPFLLIREMCRKTIAEPGTAPNGRPAESPANSGASGGPPSVS
jgi:hypothetical protein